MKIQKIINRAFLVMLLITGIVFFFGAPGTNFLGVLGAFLAYHFIFFGLSKPQF